MSSVRYHPRDADDGHTVLSLTHVEADVLTDVSNLVVEGQLVYVRADLVCNCHLQMRHVQLVAQL